MKWLLKTGFCLFIAVCVRSEICRTSKDEEGECLPINKCPGIYVKQADKQISDDDLKKLECGSTYAGPKVCCTLPEQKVCRLPTGLLGECKPLYACKPVIIALGLDKIESEFVQRLSCGGTDIRPEVCCGELFNNTEPERYAIAPRSLCGLQHYDDYFHTDNDTAITEFPWVARIAYRRSPESYVEFLCSGSIISTKYVLTAAQCLNDDLEPLFARLGEYHSLNETDCAYYPDISADECTDFKDLKVEKYIRHPGYDNKTGVHDIGIIKLNESIKYTDYIRPVCLLSSKIPRPKVTDQLAISSWGWTRQIYNIFIRTKFRQKTRVRLTTADECRQHNITLQENQACTIYTNTKTCLYENGGPVVYSYKHQWFQEGIALSGMKNCVGLSAPLLYTNVSMYVNWINETIFSN
ncbi:hypothetical protein ILUMI_19267 [Ignelater luminosus]|uniref:CLIP domain-containing serine protease n=1 Tax=Ignelater luminosus TaxID=2038154 RepID=A0A8K0G5R6_IGNLU|nr:hypothetical protein ILUMI_19267 [Ignelater luminosus]